MLNFYYLSELTLFLDMRVITLTLILIIGYSLSTFCQTTLHGKLTDSKSKSTLPYVNIGIKGKNIGTISQKDGSFSITIPQDHITDTLTFSLIGYHEFNVAVNKLDSEDDISIQLIEKPVLLNELVVQGQKLVEKKYGIKKTGAVLRFTDGIFEKDDSFEIGQVINLGAKQVKISSLNLHINSSRKDSASFRIKFYRYDEDQNAPTTLVYDGSIIQRHPIKVGWLTFDLSDYNVRLKGKVFAAIEFIPENRDVSKIFYEVKLGGGSKSFFRISSLGQWVRPPHHYCLSVTALTDKGAPDESDDVETPATFVLKSDFSKEPFSIFVRLPKGYSKNTKEAYPVIYHLDGNAFFDLVVGSAEQLLKKKKITRDPIIVGIGYENAYLMDSLRARDYTFPASPPPDTFGISGEGANLYSFINTKLIPRIDSAYRTEKTSRTIMGHSLGGYFVLCSLLRHTSDRSVFSNYVAASPSLSYHDGYLIKEFEKLTDGFNDAKLFLSVGELEINDIKANSFNSFSKILAMKSLFRLKPEIYKNLEHMGTAVPSFEDGMEFVLNK